MKNLVIVESPAKAKTIEKFLGKDFTVLSSMGHIRDLKKKGISIDFKDNFKPEYEIPAEKQELVKKLKAAAKDADVIWLASDEDREGEAIAWHLAEVLGLDPAHARRIVFHEITKPALLHAIENPRTIDLAAFLTASSASSSRRCCGKRSSRISPPDVSSLWYCV